MILTLAHRTDMYLAEAYPQFHDGRLKAAVFLAQASPEMTVRKPLINHITAITPGKHNQTLTIL
ncbi:MULTISPECIES: hypothetical protein [Acidocella]|uniref:hypothetical protein n=1 Tax=Acidocella TaxID=50709 RepID=UPI001181944E|nr:MULTISPECIES: hypothetical protein [Acidocella]WBO58947.1 hypothetical protein GT370_17905 [Acidocella sp. MX-AZ03]